MNTPNSELVEIGRILKPFGVKGELKVQFYIDDETDLKKQARFFVKDKKQASGYRELTCKSVRFEEAQGFARVVFDEVGDRTVAEAWRLVPIFTEQQYINNPQDGEYFIRDLLDLEVWYQEQIIGKIFNVIEVANQDIFVIRQANTKQDLAVPFTDYYVSKIIIEERKIVFDHLDELL